MDERVKQYAAGEQIDTYVVDAFIGSGGVGAVYEVSSDKGDEFALKISRYDVTELPLELREEHAERLRREFQTLQQCHHPNIVRVFGFGHHEGTPYFTMERI